MINHEQAQQLHQCIGQAIEQDGDWRVALEQALEIAAVIVADTMEDRTPDPAAKVSYDPCIQGTIEIGGRKSEFLFLLDRGDVGFSQWGADNETLWERVGLLDAMSITAKEWWLDNRPDEDRADED